MEPSLEYTNILRGSSESEASDLGGMELQPEPEPRPVPEPEPEPEPEPRLLDRHSAEPPGGGIRSMLSKLRESQQRELEHTAVDARQVYAEIQARQLQEQIDAMQLSGAASPLGRSAREDAIRRPGAVLQPQPAGDLPAWFVDEVYHVSRSRSPSPERSSAGGDRPGARRSSRAAWNAGPGVPRRAASGDGAHGGPEGAEPFRHTRERTRAQRPKPPARNQTAISSNRAGKQATGSRNGPGLPAPSREGVLPPKQALSLERLFERELAKQVRFHLILI